jgi:hypothetical protein
LHVLKVRCLTLEQTEIISQHFPIQFFTNKLFSFVLIILGFSIIIDIAVEENKLVPFLDVLTQVVNILLTNIEEGISACHVVHHNCSTGFIEKLLLKELAFIEKFLKSLSLFWKHEHFGFGKVISDFINFFDDCWVLNLPGLIILFLEQFQLFSIQQLLSLCEFKF